MGLFARSTRPSERQRMEFPQGFAPPAKTQWAYTPDLVNSGFGGGISGTVLTGTELAPRVNLHHDASTAEMEISAADGGLGLAFGAFDGSFLSLALGLPEDGLRGLGRNDLVRIALRSESAEPFKAYARLNLAYGPNTEQIVRMLEIGNGESFAEFDIFYSEFDPQRASNAWIDVIFNEPSGRRFTLSDAVILRRVRASL